VSVFGFFRRMTGGGAEGPVRELSQLCAALLAESGEYASTALAREAVAKWRALDDAAREQFFDVLATQYSPAETRLKTAAADYQADPSSENLIRPASRRAASCSTASTWRPAALRRWCR
jgi:hypothetical protein